MTSDTSNLSTSFQVIIPHGTSNAEPLIDTHLLKVSESGSIIVYGVLEETHNTDYKIILYFDGEFEINTLR